MNGILSAQLFISEQDLKQGCEDWGNYKSSLSLVMVAYASAKIKEMNQKIAEELRAWRWKYDGYLTADASHQLGEIIHKMEG